MTLDTRPLTRLPIGSAWLSALTDQPRPLDAGMFSLAALPTSPYWARRHTRQFLGACRGMPEDTAQTAELLVSELVTNAVRFAGNLGPELRYPDRANAGLITLSLRHFCEGLLIEVHDTDYGPPIQSALRDLAENGRGLMLVDALSEEWSYFFPPDGGKVVYCFLEISMIRYHDVGQSTTAELERARRELRANLGLLRPGSPAHVPIQKQMHAIETELSRRPGNHDAGMNEHHDS